MPYYKDKVTGEVFFSDTDPNEQAATSTSSLFGSTAAQATQAEAPTPAEQPSRLGSILRGAGSLAKEVITAPARAVAAPFAIVSEEFPALLKGKKTESNALSQFAFRGTEPGTRERGGAALEGALDIGTAALGGTIAKAGLKEATKSGVKAGTKSLLRSAARTAPIDAALGAGFGAASSIRSGGEGEDILKSSLIGAGIGAAAPFVLGGAIKGTQGVLGGAIKAADTGLSKKLTNYAEELAQLQKEVPVIRIDQKAANLAKQEKIKAAMQKTQWLKDTPERFITDWVDSFHPVEKVVGAIEKATGREFKTGRSVIENLRKAPIVAGAEAEARLGKFVGLIEDFGDDWVYVSEFRDLMDAQDLVRLGKVVEGGASAASIRKGFAKLRKEVADKGLDFNKVVEGQKQLRQFLNEELQNAVDAGVVSKEAAAAYAKARPNYSPHEVLDFLENPVGFSVSRRGAQGAGFKAATGSKKALANRDATIIKRMIDQRVRSTVNKARVNAVDALIPYAETSGFKKLTPSTKGKAVDVAKEGNAIMKVYRNGVEEIYEAPKAVVEAIENMGDDASKRMAQWFEESFGGKYLKGTASALRVLATQRNPLFLITNPIRDVQQALFTSDMRLTDWGTVFARGLMSVIAPNSNQGRMFRELREQMSKAGGFTQGFFLSREGAQEAAEMAANRLSANSRTYSPKDLATGKWIEDAGGFMEEVTRMGVFYRTLKNTNNLETAAKVAREATIDFSRGGNKAKVVNKMIPFFNARIGGALTNLQAIKKNPVQAMHKLMWQAAYPATFLYANNTRYESYDSIPEWEKRQYWIIMFDEQDGVDMGGQPTKVPFYIKVPKGEMQQAAAAITDRVLDVGRKENPQGTGEFLLDLVKGVSPVTEANILPTGLLKPVELMTDYNFFTKESITPEWVYIDGKGYAADELPARLRTKYNTSEVAKLLGSVFNWSPTKIDHVLKTGVLNDILRGLDIPLRDLTGSEDPFKAVEGSLFYDVAQQSGARKFLGTSSYGAIQKEQEAELKSKIDENLQKIKGISGAESRGGTRTRRTLKSSR